MKHKVVVIPGDGIGPEVTSAVLRVLEAAEAPLELETHHAGEEALRQGFSKTLPPETVEAIAAARLALKGPCSTPIGGGFTSVNVGLRKKLNLYAAVRPVVSLPGVPTRFEGVDLVVIRENTEGLYSGLENEVTAGVVASMKVATQTACSRIARWAFRFATHRRRRKITVFHKANIMKLSDGMFIANTRKIHKEDYPNIDYEETIIDAGCMKLVQDPTRFDILLMENLYGDVVSDLCAGLVGGLGVVPGANFGDEVAVFEAVHGSAPDIAGQDRANPLALLMSAEMMLEHIGDQYESPAATSAAQRIRRGYRACLEEGLKTGDLGGTLGCSAMARAIIERLG